MLLRAGHLEHDEFERRTGGDDLVRHVLWDEQKIPRSRLMVRTAGDLLSGNIPPRSAEADLTPVFATATPHKSARVLAGGCESILNAWHCSGDMGPWDAAPGKCQITFGAVADTMPPIPITVTKCQVLSVEPGVGQLRLHWNGSNDVACYLLDHTGDKTLSSEGILNAWRCAAGKVCAQDLGPGNYLVKVGAVGYQPMKVTIVPHYRRHDSVGQCSARTHFLRS